MKPLRIHIEFANRNWSAYSPDIDGVISTGATIEECAAEFLDAFAFHVEGSKPGELPPLLPDSSRALVFATVGADQLRAFRKYHGVTQKDLADKLGTIQARISAIERNPGIVGHSILQKYFSTILDMAAISDPIALAA